MPKEFPCIIKKTDAGQAHREARMTRSLRNFPKLPDEAVVSPTVTSRVADCSLATVWRRIRDGILIAHRVGPRMTRVNVGSIRQMLRGQR